MPFQDADTTEKTWSVPIEPTALSGSWGLGRVGLYQAPEHSSQCGGSVRLFLGLLGLVEFLEIALLAHKLTEELPVKPDWELSRVGVMGCGPRLSKLSMFLQALFCPDPGFISV